MSIDPSNVTPMVRLCPDCGGKASRRIVACPHCGAPLEDTPSASRNDVTGKDAAPASKVEGKDGSWKLLLLGPLALVVMGGVIYFTSRPPVGDMDQLRSDVTRDFLDPSSAELRNVRWLGGGSVCGEVNGTNAFGGKTGFRGFYASEKSDKTGFMVMIAARSEIEDSFVARRCRGEESD